MLLLSHVIAHACKLQKLVVVQLTLWYSSTLTAGVHGMQDSLRAAGSHLYRLAPLLLELARAFSGAVAAMQGQAGPLALNASSYIRPDGQSVVQLLPLLLQLHTSTVDAPSHHHSLALVLCGVTWHDSK